MYDNVETEWVCQNDNKPVFFSFFFLIRRKQYDWKWICQSIRADFIETILDK